MDIPRTPGTMFIVNPELDTETLLAHACESLASANVMTMDLADHLDGPRRNSFPKTSTRRCLMTCLMILKAPKIESNDLHPDVCSAYKFW
jgi:hypothetical protein